MKTYLTYIVTFLLLGIKCSILSWDFWAPDESSINTEDPSDKSKIKLEEVLADKPAEKILPADDPKIKSVKDPDDILSKIKPGDCIGEKPKIIPDTLFSQSCDFIYKYRYVILFSCCAIVILTISYGMDLDAQAQFNKDHAEEINLHKAEGLVRTMPWPMFQSWQQVFYMYPELQRSPGSITMPFLIDADVILRDVPQTFEGLSWRFNEVIMSKTNPNTLYRVYMDYSLPITKIDHTQFSHLGDYAVTYVVLVDTTLVQAAPYTMIEVGTKIGFEEVEITKTLFIKRD